MSRAGRVERNEQRREGQIGMSREGRDRQG